MELQANYGLFRTNNIQIIAVSMDDVSDAGEMVTHAKATYPVLADPTQQTAKDYGVFNLLDDEVAAPATFIIDSDGIIRWLHIGRDAADRPTVEGLLQVLGLLQL